jgi:hypothetical protein
MIQATNRCWMSLVRSTLSSLHFGVRLAGYRLAVALAIVTGSVVFTSPAAAQIDWDPDNNPLTVGPNNEFIVGVYQIVQDAAMADAAAKGFNVVQSYSYANESGTQNPGYPTPDEFITGAASHGLSVMMQLGVLTPTEPDVPLAEPADIQQLAQYDNIAMWSIVPEEISWWPQGTAQFNQLIQWANNIHANDPKNRPVFHYLASNYAEVDLKAYTGFIDAITAGAYADHGSKPRPWIRWRIEQQVNAITNTGSRPGVFPVATLQMFASEGFPGETMMQAQDGYHDAYLSLVAGAKAVMIFTGGRRFEVPGLYDRYSDFAKEINGPERLGDVFLLGTDLGEFAPVKPVVLGGPAKSEAFTESFVWPPSGPTVQYDSISYRVMSHNGNIYIAAVNSAEQPVTVAIPGVRSPVPVEVMFQGRTAGVLSNQILDTFTPTGVNIYKLPAAADLIVNEEAFDGPDGVVADWTPRFADGTIFNSNGVTTVVRGSAVTEYFLHDVTPMDLPEGAFIELQIKADTGTAFYLELVDPQGGSAALIDWQLGTGDWQTIRADFSGSWASTSSFWLGIRSGVSYEVRSLGIYYGASAVPLLVGDLDGDGFVGINDLNIVLGAWNQAVPPGNPLADPSGDGFVGIDDINIVLGNWNVGTPPAADAVPEPATLVVFAIVSTMALNRMLFRFP